MQKYGIDIKTIKQTIAGALLAFIVGATPMMTYAQEGTVLYIPIAQQGASEAAGLDSPDAVEDGTAAPFNAYQDEVAIQKYKIVDEEVNGSVQSASITAASVSAAGMSSYDSLVEIIKPTSYQLKKCKNDDRVYIDRKYEFTEFSHKGYHNKLCIRTANGHKKDGSDDLLVFNLKKAAEIRIYLDRRAKTLPSWFGNKYDKDDNKKARTTDGNMGYFEIYSCKSKAGLITLGGPQRGSSGIDSMYVVQIVEIDESKGKTDCSTKASSSNAGKNIWVRKGANGNGSQAAPYGSLQKAVNSATPGTTINIERGTYVENVLMTTSGKKDQPITIKAAPGVGPGQIYLRAKSKGRVFQITGSHINIEGFTIDGYDGGGNSKSDYPGDILLYILAPKGSKDSGPTDINIQKMYFRNAGGECLRLRYWISDVTIEGNYFNNCGVHAFKFQTSECWRQESRSNCDVNGEAVYVGTAHNQREHNVKPIDDGGKFGWRSHSDNTRNIKIRGNRMVTNGNECVDIKKDANNVLVEGNWCSMQKDVLSGGINIDGHNNIVRNNRIFDNLGVAVRIGDNGGNVNSVYGNVIYSNRYGGLKIKQAGASQRKICGNNLDQQNPKDDWIRGDGKKYYKDKVASPC